MKAEQLRVMVVDDSRLVLERLRYALERAGHSVSLRESSLGTVSAVIKERPDVLILDVSMPALDGHRLATLVNEVNQEVTLILHSSRQETELAELAAAAGAQGYICKTNDTLLFLTEFRRIVAAARRASGEERISASFAAAGRKLGAR